MPLCRDSCGHDMCPWRTGTSIGYHFGVRKRIDISDLDAALDAALDAVADQQPGKVRSPSITAALASSRDLIVAVRANGWSWSDIRLWLGLRGTVVSAHTVRAAFYGRWRGSSGAAAPDQQHLLDREVRAALGDLAAIKKDRPQTIRAALRSRRERISALLRAGQSMQQILDELSARGIQTTAHTLRDALYRRRA